LWCPSGQSLSAATLLHTAILNSWQLCCSTLGQLPPSQPPGLPPDQVQSVG
jgi:hypothetical protein